MYDLKTIALTCTTKNSHVNTETRKSKRKSSHGSSLERTQTLTNPTVLNSSFNGCVSWNNHRSRMRASVLFTTRKTSQQSPTASARRLFCFYDQLAEHSEHSTADPVQTELHDALLFPFDGSKPVS